MKLERFLCILVLLFTAQYCAIAITDKVKAPSAVDIKSTGEASTSSTAVNATVINPENGADKKIESITWFDNLENAMTAAVVDYKSVFILLTSPACPICTKLKDTTLKDPEVLKELSKFISVEIDAGRNRQIADRLMLRGVPCMIIVSGGREFDRAYGYMKVSDTVEFLRKVSEQSADKKEKKKLDEYLSMIKGGKMTREQWEELIVFMGKAPVWIKDSLNSQIKKMQFFPADILIKLLTYKDLSVRLGTLELLEDFSGTDFGFDPWDIDEPSIQNEAAVAKWKEWAEKSKSPKDFQIAPVISKEKCMEFLNDIAFSDNPEKVSRAIKQISGARAVAIPLIDEFLLKNKESITLLKQNEFRILKYKIIIPDRPKMPSETMARRLVTGNPDTKIQSLHELISYGKPVTAILDEMRQDNNPVIREAVFDVLFRINQQSALKIAEKHLATEKNKDVIIGIIRSIGLSKLQADNIMNTFLASKDEDILLQTLESISLSGKKYKKTESIVELLSSPSWRVRAAALGCVEKLSLKNCASKVEDILNDPDDFVRHKAISVYPLLLSSKGKSLKKLEELYYKNDSMKAAVLDVFLKNNMKITTDMINALKDKDAQVIEQVIQTLENADKDALPLAVFLSRSKYPGVAAQAAEFIASKANLGNDWIKAAFELLKNGETDVRLAVLKNFAAKNAPDVAASGKVREEIQTRMKAAIGKNKTLESAGADKNIPKKTLSALISKYFGDKEGTASSNEQGKDLKSDSVKQPGPLKEISEYLLKAIKETDSEEFFYYAALALMDMKNQDAVNYFIDEFDSFSSDRKIEILKKAMGSRMQEKAIILTKAILDHDKEVKDAAFESLDDIDVKTNAWQLEFILEKILNGDFPISIVDLTRSASWLNTFLDNKQMEIKLKKLAANMLTSPEQKKENIIFSLLVYAWKPEKTSEEVMPVIEKLTNSEDQLIRRAAWFAYLKVSPEKFQDSLGKISADPSEYVRIIIPLLAQYSKLNNLEWVNFYDTQKFFMIYDHNWNNKKRQYVKVTREVKDELESLTEDVSLKVRIDAFIALLLNQEKISQDKFEAVVESVPDQKSVVSRLDDIITEKYQNIDKSMSFLVRYLEEDKDKEKLNKINKYFNIAADNPNPANVTAAEKIEPSVKIEFAEKTSEKKNTESKNAEDKKAVKLVFFSKAGCKDCRQIKIYLGRLKNIFQELEVKEYDMNNRDAIRLNQAYCMKFGVPDKNHMVAPVVFTSSGYLIKENINFDSLSKNISKAIISGYDDSWANIKQEEMDNSETAIRGKYDTFTFWVILSAGLLDGINPCAFATIIFFISYLRISRRDPVEIIKTAGAFILGVFLAYYLLGIGFTGIVDVLSKFKVFSLLLNILIAFLCIILAAVSFYDGIMCMRGKIKDMKLQLPEFLKERIRNSIRVSIKSRYIIIAAFTSGIIVSMLELACTGQVYVPAIMVMLKNAETSASAMTYLFLYNIAFIVPLVIATVLTYCGVENQKFSAFIQRHAAGVKFSTALLFLVFMLVAVAGIYKII